MHTYNEETNKVEKNNVSRLLRLTTCLFFNGIKIHVLSSYKLTIVNTSLE